MKFAVPKHLDFEEKASLFILPRRSSVFNQSFSKLSNLTFLDPIDMVRCKPKFLYKAVEALYVVVIKTKVTVPGTSEPQKQLKSIHLPRPIPGVSMSMRAERSFYLNVPKKTIPMTIIKETTIEYASQAVNIVKTRVTSITNKSKRNLISKASGNNSKSMANSLAKKNQVISSSYKNNIQDDLKEDSADSINGSVRSSRFESIGVVPPKPQKIKMKDVQLSTEKLNFDAMTVRTKITEDPKVIEPMFQTEDILNMGAISMIHSDKISYKLDLIRLPTSSIRLSPLKDRVSIALDTIDLKVDTPSQMANSQSINIPSINNASSVKHESIVPSNVMDLIKAMKQNMYLNNAMKVKFVDHRLTRPIEPIEKTLHPMVPQFSVKLRNSKMMPPDIPNHGPLLNVFEHPAASRPQQESKIEKIADKDDANNSTDNISQKTRSFRIKEYAKKSNQEGSYSNSGALRVGPELKRPSQVLSENSDRTKKGTRNSMRSVNSGDINDREHANNAEIKKLEPLIVKYNEASKWSSDKERLRLLVAEHLKQKSPFLSGFSLEFIDTLLSLGQFSFQAKDSMLFTEGDNIEKMGIVMYGVIKYSIRDNIVTLTHGGMIAEECLFNSGPIKMENSMILSKICILWLPSTCLQELRIFCDSSKKKNEYVLFVANIQKQIKQKS